MKPYVSKNQRVWIKSSGGEVFVCSVDALKQLKDPKNPTEEELAQLCLNDSRRPDNY